VTTLRNRNPNRNHLLDWSAEASSVENICGGAFKLRAILKFPVESPRRASVLGVTPLAKNHFGN
jgi:hypothetical protein